jgi:predicted PurR-regulated permease PerM
MDLPVTLDLAKHGNFRGNRAIILLRIFLWLIPAIILPLAIYLALWLGGLWYLSPILLLLAFTAIGYFDMLLIHQQGRTLSKAKPKRLFAWAITFTVIQLIIAPGVIFLIAVVTDRLSTGLLNRPPFWMP